MTDDIAHLMLEHLKHIRSKVDVLALDIADVKSRMTGVEIQLGQLSTQYAGQSARLDRVEERLGRIERRFDLVEA